METGAVFRQGADAHLAVVPTTLPKETGNTHEQIVVRSVTELRLHPGIQRHNLAPSIAKLTALASRGEDAFRDPLVTTREGYILDGQARWVLAKRQGRTELRCFERNLTEEEALVELLRKQQRSTGLNSFIRVTLALELEPWFKTRASENQRSGGQLKGSLMLTEAHRIDVRAEIAIAAGVSESNVTRIKQLLSRAIPELKDALRRGEISINKGWKWSKRSSHEQKDWLELRYCERGIDVTIQSLLRKHKAGKTDRREGLKRIRSGLALLRGDEQLHPVLRQLNQTLQTIGIFLEDAERRDDAG